jgi:hypothetical protein
VRRPRFYAIATTIANFFPGKPNAIVGAFTAFVAEVDANFAQYHSCLVGKNWLGQLGCAVLRDRNLAFAAGRGVISGGAKAALGAILSGYTWSNWLSASVSDSGASLHESGTIRIAAAALPSPPAPQPTAPPPTTTASAPPQTTTSAPAAPQGGAPTCTEYEQMSDLQKEQALEAMQAAHHDTTPLIVVHGSVGLFCKIYPDHTIDGVYNGSL